MSSTLSPTIILFVAGYFIEATFVNLTRVPHAIQIKALAKFTIEMGCCSLILFPPVITCTVIWKWNEGCDGYSLGPLGPE